MSPDHLRNNPPRHDSYTLLESIRPERVRFAFTGPFHGRRIVWNATLFTLAHYHDTQLASAEPIMRRPFIEIGDATAVGRIITVALDIPAIDAPTLLRTVIMIRQYRRLRAGRHEFGEPRTFPPHAGA